MRHQEPGSTQAQQRESPSSDFNGCPRKSDPWARAGSGRGLRGASTRGSMRFLPACETLEVEIASLEGLDDEFLADF